MQIPLSFGESKILVELPAPLVLEAQELPALPEPGAAVEQALTRPLGCPPLAELAQGKRSACIVVSDITRPVPNPVLLPPLPAGGRPERAA